MVGVETVAPVSTVNASAPMCTPETSGAVAVSSFMAATILTAPVGTVAVSSRRDHGAPNCVVAPVVEAKPPGSAAPELSYQYSTGCTATGVVAEERREAHAEKVIDVPDAAAAAKLVKGEEIRFWPFDAVAGTDKSYAEEPSKPGVVEATVTPGPTAGVKAGSAVAKVVGSMFTAGSPADVEANAGVPRNLFTL